MAAVTKKEENIQTRHRSEIFGLLVITFSMVILVSKVIRPQGSAFSYFLDMISIVEIFIGAGIYVISLFLWYLGVEIFRGRSVLESPVEYVGFSIFFFTSLSLIWFAGGDSGSLGTLLGGVLQSTFGRGGGILFLFFFLLVGISMGFRILIGTLLLNMWQTIVSSAILVYAFLRQILVLTGRVIIYPIKLLKPAPIIVEVPATAAKKTKKVQQKPTTEAVFDQDHYIPAEPIVITGNEDTDNVTKEPTPTPPKIEEQDITEPLEDEPTPVKKPTTTLIPGKVSRDGEFATIPQRKRTFDDYEIPSVELLPKPDLPPTTSEEELREKADKIIRTLRSFKVEAAISQITHGPSVTRFELVPASGVHVKKIVSLTDDLALNLATSSIRMEAPIPGKSAVGIEVPNEKSTVVHFATLVRHKDFTAKKHPLLIALGKTITGQPIIADLAVMPHLLIAGATGSGKSVCMNTIIASILFRANPKQVRFIMVDPKKVELSAYDNIPHLLHPVVVDPKKAQSALMWAVTEMERRYELLSHYNTRNISGFNKILKTKRRELEDIISSDAPLPDEMTNIPDDMPYIVIIIDELADLMMTNTSDKVEESICRLAQMARAVGIHLVVATQRPSVNVITGLIKANMPSRIAFMVTSVVDSRTILDMKGAESLLGRGDMLYNPVGAPKPIRVQGAFVSDEEVYGLTSHIKSRWEAVYEDEVASAIEGAEIIESKEPLDPMIEDAIRLVVSNKSGSTSMLQRVLKVGHTRAMNLMTQMEVFGVVGPFEDKKPRKVLWTIEDVESRAHTLV